MDVLAALCKSILGKEKGSISPQLNGKKRAREGTVWKLNLLLVGNSRSLAQQRERERLKRPPDKGSVSEGMKAKAPEALA